MGALVQSLREPDVSRWEGAGIDTVHLTYRESLSMGGLDLASELGGLFDALGLNGGVTPRNRGLHGFEHGVTFVAGALLDWTPGNGEGPNQGYASVQLKGDFFKQLGPEESTIALLLLNDLKPYRCTRIDPQMTHCNTVDVPWVISMYRQGALKTIRKKSFEPKGKETGGGLYPEGATLVHGARTSENYARQYDKHLEEAAKGAAEPGPPRRRDEIELKGSLAQSVWQELVTVLAEQEALPTPNWTAEARFSKALVRHYLPIRDTSEWGTENLPANWASTAPEPAWWAQHFSEDAIRIRRERGPSSGLLKRIGYMRKHYGSLYLQALVLEQLKVEKAVDDRQFAETAAMVRARDLMIRHAADHRLQELLDNLPNADQQRAIEIWNDWVRTAADNEEDARDFGLK